MDLTAHVRDNRLTWRAPAGPWQVMLFVCVPDAARGLVDYLDPEAARKFVELTYEKYYQTFPEHFGKTIDSAFYDEPTFHVGRGWVPDTDQVPDASRITPEPLPQGMRDGNDVQISVKLDAEMPIQDVTGVTHELDVTNPSPTEAQIRLKNQTAIPNKDFVVEYRLAGEDTVLASLTHRSESDGYFALVLQPKWQIETAELMPWEVVLLLDTSGSMSGSAIGQLRIFAQHALDYVNPQDTIRVVSFSNSPEALHSQPVPATPDNLAAAKQFIRNLRSGGGTQMLPALQAALGPSGGEQSRVRYLVLVTDALVGNDSSILGYLKQPEFADVRVFPVAMGAAPNHYLISRAAELSRGFAMQVTNQDNAAEMAQRNSHFGSFTPLTWGIRSDRLDPRQAMQGPWGTRGCTSWHHR